MVRNSISTDYVETTRNLMDLTTTFNQPPSAETVLLYIGKKDRKDIKLEFDCIFRQLIKLYQMQGILTEPADIAIDIHDKPYYGKCMNQDVIKGQEKKGAHYFHKYLTMDNVEQDHRFTFCGSHFTQFDDRFKVFQSLLTFLDENDVESRHLYVDREFFNSKVTDHLITDDIKFVMPAKRNKKLKRRAQNNWENGKFVFTYTFHEGSKRESLPVTIFLIANEDFDPSKKPEKGNEEYYLFATNIEIKESDHNATTVQYNDRYPGKERHDLSEYYRKRWGIETDYRVLILNQNFQAKTTSNNFSIRLFNFLSGVTLRNLWELSKLRFKPLYEHLFPKKTMTATLWSRVLELFLNAKNTVSGLTSLRSKLAALRG